MEAPKRKSQQLIDKEEHWSGQFYSRNETKYLDSTTGKRETGSGKGKPWSRESIDLFWTAIKRKRPSKISLETTDLLFIPFKPPPDAGIQNNGKGASRWFPWREYLIFCE